MIFTCPSLTTTFILQLWQINVAEQMIVNDMEINPDKYKGKKISDLEDEDDFNEENAVQHTKVPYKNAMLPKVTLVSTSLIVIFGQEAVIVFLSVSSHTWVEYKTRVS